MSQTLTPSMGSLLRCWRVPDVGGDTLFAKWRPNDIVLWDNRCTMHQALGDFDETQSRYLERSNVLGTPLGYVAQSA